VRRRRPFRSSWILLLVSLAALGYFGGRWAISIYYPLEYREIIFARAAEFQLSPYLVASVIRNESGFRPNATSSQGARGLMQIMPETGEWAARQLDLPFSLDLLYDPDYNVRLGCWYLSELKQEFAGELVLMLAAYNGGRGNVQKWLNDRQWTGEHHTLEQIPFQETRQYVTKVLRDYSRYERIYANPDQRER
jgi:soluble lytic murein transglycosylase